MSWKATQDRIKRDKNRAILLAKQTANTTGVSQFVYPIINGYAFRQANGDVEPLGMDYIIVRPDNYQPRSPEYEAWLKTLERVSSGYPELPYQSTPEKPEDYYTRQ